MDYEKKYKNALTIAQSRFKIEKDESVLTCLGMMFPELRESDDERARKRAIAILKQQRDYWSYDGPIDKFPPATPRKDLVDAIDVALSYLEKQKENHQNADSIPADCVSSAKCEDRNSKYGVFPEDVIVVARACEKLEMHGYPELAHALKNVNLYTKPVDYDHEMWKNCEANFEGGKKEVIDHPEKYGLQKEQKPAEWEDYKDKVNIPYCSSEPEWSEEDEEMIKMILGDLEWERRNTTVDKDIRHYDEEIAWLKSLSPSWKPSEEQMNCLCAAVDAAIRKHNESVSGYEPARVLKSLYEQLKKLM